MPVVVGYIPTREGLAAVERAITEAELRLTRLVVVNTGYHGDDAHPAFADPKDLHALAGQLAARGLDHEIRQPTTGAPAGEVLLAVADDVDAELIVIGLRRRSSLGTLITGSTAQHVLLGASCDVLAVKAPA